MFNRAEERLIKKIDSKVEKGQFKGDGFVINYIKSGKGKPLLLLHGANVGWGMWHPNIAHLAKHFCVYALDIPGSGKSSNIDFKNFNFDRDFVRPIEDFISKKKLKKINILAHSLGGVIALKLAQNNKNIIERMILLNPLGFTRKIPNSQLIVSIKPFVVLLSKTVLKPSKKNMASFLKSPMLNPDNLSDEFIDYFYSSIVKFDKYNPLIFLSNLTKRFKLHPSLKASDDLSKINSEVLILIGDRDKQVYHKDTFLEYKKLRKSELRILSESGHLPSMDNPEKFNQIVISYFK
jgi:pimeloyl-ACP methyl ester carboxylesterase